MAHNLSRRQTLTSLALLCVTGGRAFAQTDQDPDAWPDLVRMFFNDATIVEDQGLVAFEAPPRAEDAALVPVSFSARLPEGDPRRVVKLTLVIDQNPVPLAAAFTLGEKAGDTRISTRVRVNSYTNARVVAELSDGSLHMATRYIKASGGCSAPMVKTMDEALATLGQMKFRVLPATPESPHEQSTLWPQLFVSGAVPHWFAQVTLGGSGVQQVPASASQNARVGPAQQLHSGAR